MVISRKRIAISVLLTLCFFFAVFSSSYSQSDETPTRKAAKKFAREGLAAFKEGNYDEAKRLYTMAIETDKFYAPPYAYLGDYYSFLSQREEAIKLYKKATENDEENTKYLLTLGELYYDEQKYEEARDTLSKIPNEDHNNPAYLWAMGRVQQGLGENDNALANLDILLQNLDKGNKWESDNELKDIYWKTHKLIGSIYMDQKKWNLAHQHFQKIIEQSDDDTLKSTVDKLYKIVDLKRKEKMGITIGAVIVTIPLILLILFWRFLVKPNQQDRKMHLPSSAADAKDFFDLSNFAIQHFRLLTQMPKGLIYFIDKEGEPLKLVLSEGIEPELFKELKVDWEDITKWIGSNGDRPFIYEVEKKEILFIRAFPHSREKLEPASPRIGIPFIYQNALRGICFMCYPQLQITDKRKLKTIFKKNVDTIHRTGIDIGISADRIFKRKSSITDTITPAYNQIYLREKLGIEVRKAKEKGKPLALIMMEIDSMEAILKRFGEERKNYVLKTIVETIHQKLGTEVISIFRVSDFRFAMIFPGQDSKRSQETTREIGRLIGELKFTSPIPSVTMTAGMACYPEHAVGQESLESTARNALDNAIQEGRNRLVIVAETTVPILCPTGKSSIKPMDSGKLTAAIIGEESQNTITLEPISPVSDNVMSYDIPEIKPVKAKNESKGGAFSFFQKKQAPVEKQEEPVRTEPQEIQHSKPPKEMKPYIPTISLEDVEIEEDPESKKPSFAFREAQKQAPSLHSASADGDQNKTGNSPRQVRRIAPASHPGMTNTQGNTAMQQQRKMSRSYDTSSLKAPPQMRSSGSSTSKLSAPAMPSTTTSKPMIGLIRRSKSAKQVPGLKRRTPSSGKLPASDIAGGSSSAANQRRISSSPKTEALGNVRASQVALKKIQVNIGKPGSAKPDNQPVSPANARVPKAMPNQATQHPQGAVPQHYGAQVHPGMGRRMIPPGAIDAVTGFFFKSYFEQSIGRQMLRASQTRRPLALLFFKLDRHKELKTKYGQDKLDNVLKEIALMIKNFLKEGSDIPARYSDEIFVIILPDTSYQIAFNLAEQIRFTVGNLSFKDIPGHITMSLGIAAFPEKGRSPKEVMKNSYDAMVFAIKSGGNRSVIWDEKLFQRRR